MTTTYIATLVVRIFAKGTAEATLPLLGQQVVFHCEWGDYADPHAVSVWTYGAPHAEMIGYRAGKEAEIVADLIENGRVLVGEFSTSMLPRTRTHRPLASSNLA